MMTWHLDRLARSATLCLILATVLPLVMGFVINAQSDVENVLGGMLVGAVFIGLGAIAGSTVTSGAGIVLFGIVASFAQPGALLLGIAGVVLLAALLLVDMSITVRRAPLIDRVVWSEAALSFLIVAAVASVATAIALTLAGLATWQAVVLPMGLVAVGYAVRFAADAHEKHVPR